MPTARAFSASATDPLWLIRCVTSGLFWPSGSLDSSARCATASQPSRSASVISRRSLFSVCGLHAAVPVVAVEPAVAVVAGIETANLQPALHQVRGQNRADVAVYAGDEDFHSVSVRCKDARRLMWSRYSILSWFRYWAQVPVGGHRSVRCARAPGTCHPQDLLSQLSDTVCLLQFCGNFPRHWNRYLAGAAAAPSRRCQSMEFGNATFLTARCMHSISPMIFSLNLRPLR